MNEVYLLIGGNMGNRLSYIKASTYLIEKKIGKIMSTSSVYETEAWGYNNQPSFLNKCLKIQTQLLAEEVLFETLTIEKSLGRIRLEKYSPRYIDIDILLYNQDIVNTHDLIIPHPEIQNRKFALIPLIEISPNLFHPTLNKKMTELLDICTDNLDVKKFSGSK